MAYDEPMIMLDIAILILVATICWRGYQRRQTWLRMIPFVILKSCRGKNLLFQLLIIAPIVAGWLLGCHWINTAGWHATGMAGVLVAMTAGLEAMRSFEERQKHSKSQ